MFPPLPSYISFRIIRVFVALRCDAVCTLQFLDKCDILGLGVLRGRLRVHELLPSVVFVFPLRGTINSVDVLSAWIAGS